MDALQVLGDLIKHLLGAEERIECALVNNGMKGLRIKCHIKAIHHSVYASQAPITLTSDPRKGAIAGAILLYNNPRNVDSNQVVVSIPIHIATQH